MTCSDHRSQLDEHLRLLLRVLGFRTQGAAYRFDDDADQFWLALEGDAPDQVLWMKPDWRYFGPNFGFGMVAEKITLAYGETPPLASNQFHYSPAHWQTLCGMVLQTVRSSTMYDPPHTAALSLHFAPWVQLADMAVNKATASLMFDAPDLDEPLNMLISDDANLGHWALCSDVQQHLSTNNVLPWEASWNAPWNIPPTPWNDRAHFVALAHFRAVLQDFAVWWQTQTEWPISSRSRQDPAPGMWKAVGNLCALQIVLGFQQTFQTAHGGWLDHDEEEYGSAWYRLDGATAYTDLAQRLGAGITDWLRWMSWDEWHALLGPESCGFYAVTKACWQEVIRAHMTWLQQFATLLD
jgi:hypothetical protein